MKKLLLITFCFCTILVVQSQEKELKKEKEIEFGIAGGLDVFTFTTLSGIVTGNTIENRLEISEPSTSYVNIFAEKSLSEKFGIRTEIIYAMGGGESNTLEIPIIFKYKPLKNLNFYSGLQANFLLVRKNSVSNKAGFGFNVGAEYYLVNHFFVDTRYVHKFSQLKSNFRVDKAINSVRLGVGYKF